MKVSSMNMLLITLLPLLLILPKPAFAYIGPGAGLGVIAAVVALGIGGILLVVGFAWYPLRRLLRSRKKSEIDHTESLK